MPMAPPKLTTLKLVVKKRLAMRKMLVMENRSTKKLLTQSLNLLLKMRVKFDFEMARAVLDDWHTQGAEFA